MGRLLLVFYWVNFQLSLVKQSYPEGRVDEAKPPNHFVPPYSLSSILPPGKDFLPENNGESMLFPYKMIFLVFLCDNSNVNYHEKTGNRLARKPHC